LRNSVADGTIDHFDCRADSEHTPAMTDIEDTNRQNACVKML
jgi:hypothetical protein